MKKNRTVPFFIILKRSKIKYLEIFLLSVIVLFTSVRTHADEKKIFTNQEEKKEILVARDVTLEPPIWCGDSAFVVSSERSGLRWIDFVNKKEVKISSSGYVGAVDCTSDSEWLIYVDTRSSRWDKGNYERGIVDFWRYNLKTGKRQKFAVAEGGGKWSPDGKKFLFYGSKPRTYIEQPEPKWDLVWSRSGLSTERGFEAGWLSDSESIVIISDNKVYIERYGRNEAAPAQLLNPNINLGTIYKLKIDKRNKIYILARSKEKKNGKTIYGKTLLLRCQTIGMDLQCKDILKGSKSIRTYDISLDGREVVFQEEENNCTWHLKERKDDPQYVTSMAGPNLSISPDAKWLTVVRPRKVEKVKGVDVYTNDLFVIKLIDE